MPDFASALSVSVQSRFWSGCVGSVSAAASERPAAIGCGLVMIVSLLTTATGILSTFSWRCEVDQTSTIAASSGTSAMTSSRPSRPTRLPVGVGVLIGPPRCGCRPWRRRAPPPSRARAAPAVAPRRTAGSASTTTVRPARSSRATTVVGLAASVAGPVGPGSRSTTTLAPPATARAASTTPVCGAATSPSDGLGAAARTRAAAGRSSAPPGPARSSRSATGRPSCRPSSTSVAVRVTDPRCSGSRQSATTSSPSAGACRPTSTSPRSRRAAVPGTSTRSSSPTGAASCTGRSPGRTTRSRASTAIAPCRSCHCSAATLRCSAAPSTSTVGSSRSSHPGSHHAARPSSTSTAGTKVIRTMNASTKTPTASPSAIGLMVLRPAGDERDEDADHDQRGRGDHLARTRGSRRTPPPRGRRCGRTPPASRRPGTSRSPWPARTARPSRRSAGS